MVHDANPFETRLNAAELKPKPAVILAIASMSFYG